jgi:hypothetical protein
MNINGLCLAIAISKRFWWFVRPRKIAYNLMIPFSNDCWAVASIIPSPAISNATSSFVHKDMTEFNIAFASS